jgi:hypothetical protein
MLSPEHTKRIQKGSNIRLTTFVNVRLVAEGSRT